MGTYGANVSRSIGRGMRRRGGGKRERGSIIGEMGGGEGLRMGFGTGADPNLAVNSEASRKIDLDRA